MARAEAEACGGFHQRTKDLEREEDAFPHVLGEQEGPRNAALKEEGVRRVQQGKEREREQRG